MLKGTKSTTFSYQSVINGTPVIYMQATIPEKGNASRSINIQNKELYDANKESCRADVSDFEALIYELEDSGQQDETTSEETASADTSEETAADSE